MADIAYYLVRHFLPTDIFAAHCGLTSEVLDELIAAGLAPKASYVVDPAGQLVSYVFGAMNAPGAPVGAWHAPAQAAWIQRGREALARYGQEEAPARLAADFRDRYRNALRGFHQTDGPIPTLCTASGQFDDAAYDSQFESVWTHFLAGTYGLCVADPRDESRVALKESLQCRLVESTEDGKRTHFTPEDSRRIRDLIVRFQAASMPFSPIEYPRSSRKRLADDILLQLDV